jgi:tetratricopeptide (TPR) repeat protein
LRSKQPCRSSPGRRPRRGDRRPNSSSGALTNTSPDRRYIALARRAREHWANGDHGKCLQDLQTLLDTPDIATEQKLEARYERAGFLKQAGHIAEAIGDLDQIITAPRNFPNVDKAAQQELDELRNAQESRLP